MNREIKFRVWNMEHKEWDHSSLLEVFDSFGVLKHLYDQNGTKTVIQQFTGVKDKNGDEIYEGDLIEVFDMEDQKQKTLEVVWGTYSDDEYVANIECWMLQEKKYNHNLPLSTCKTGGVAYGRGLEVKAGEFEVVGNIFETPDLLKK